MHDSLGTARVITASDGTVCYDADLYPYGGLRVYNSTCGPSQVFTTYERDPESGNDYAMARYFSSRLGRFMSPDPTGIFLGNLNDAQSLNLYSYVRNNPSNFIDPTGLDCEEDTEPILCGSGPTPPITVIPGNPADGTPLSCKKDLVSLGVPAKEASADCRCVGGACAGVGRGGGKTTAASLLSRLESVIPIVCSGGTFDFFGASPGAKVGEGDLESGVFFYQQADYSSKGLRYASGTLGEVALEAPGGFLGGYGKITTAQGTERLVFGGRTVGEGTFQAGGGGFVGGENGQIALGIYGEGSAGPVAGGVGYYLSFSTLAKGCHE